MILIKKQEDTTDVMAQGSTLELAEDFRCLLKAIAKDKDLMLAFVLGHRAFENDDEEDEEENGEQCSFSGTIN